MTDTDSMKWTKIRSLNSDGTVECEDGHLFTAQLDHEGTFILSNGLKAYLEPGQTICHA